MAKILVTGASGLLGSTLVPHLRAVGHSVICHARTNEADVHADLRDPVQAGSVLEKESPEVIVNLAALTDVDACERDPQAAYLANVRIVENLAVWIRNAGAGCHLIQVSTDQVYDGPGPHKEEPVTLCNYYGFSKYAGELAAATVSSTVVRTNFFGPSRISTRRSLSDWLVKSLAEGNPITVFEDIRFSPLALQHLAEILGVVIAKRHPGVYNLGSKGGMSKADFAYALAGILGLSTVNVTRGKYHRSENQACRPTDMCMDSSRFEKQFAVELPGLQEELQSMKVAYNHETR
jgi:dTDP-4-dehydrorhamnose reductase